MIGCFPDPYPDELFYSICARFNDRMRYTKKNAVIRDLFAKNVVSAVVDLPTCFDALIRNLPPSHRCSADGLIDLHTLLPFYGPFLVPSRLHRLREDMRGDNGQGLHMRIGITAHSVPLPTYLRFCSLCAEEDKKTVGECYWHRIHQVPGVLACPNHRVFIQDSNVLVRDIASRGVFISAQQALTIPSPKSLDPAKSSHAALIKIADDVVWLLGQPNLVFDGMTRHQQYIRALKERGFVTHQGLVRLTELFLACKTHYPPGLFALLRCELGDHSEENWLARLVRLSDETSSIQHPLHHLLLMQFLDYTAAAFFALPSCGNDENFPSEDHPFGEGPWPCLNAASDHYREPRVTAYTITYSHERECRPKGTFSCECGFTYSRIGPDRSGEDRFLIGKMKAFGCVWERTLQELWGDEELSLDQIASRLGVTRTTVKVHAARLELAPRKSKVCARESQWIRVPGLLQKENVEEQKQALRNSYRIAWLSIMSGEAEPDCKSSRVKIKTARTWLSRNDAEWLKEHPWVSSSQQLRVDWHRRDECLAEDVRTAASYLRNLPGRPVRISISAIRRNLNQVAVLLNHLERLPRTSEVLNEVVESYEQWGIRRIWWAAELYRQEQLCPTQGQLVRRACVEYHYYANAASVKETLDAALQTFSREDIDNTKA